MKYPYYLFMVPLVMNSRQNLHTFMYFRFYLLQLSFTDRFRDKQGKLLGGNIDGQEYVHVGDMP